MKKCPYCDADIPDSAYKCKFCGEWVVALSQQDGQQQNYNQAAPQQYYAPAPPPGYVQQPAQQLVTVNVPKQESNTFAVITLIMYLFFFIPGLILNIIGLITGPKRGCFLSMFLLFVVFPAAVILGAGYMGFDLLGQLEDLIPGLQDTLNELFGYIGTHGTHISSILTTLRAIV